MAKRQTWKTFQIPDRDEMRRLESCWQSSLQEWKKYTLNFSRGDIETNLPLKSCRELFRFAGIPWRDYVSDVKPLSEYTDEELDVPKF